MKNCLHRITTWYFKKKALPYWCILLLDCFLVIAAYLISFYVFIGGLYFVTDFWTKLGYLTLLVLPYYLISFKVFHTYANIIRYSSFNDIRNVLSCNIIAALLAIAAKELLFKDPQFFFPRIRVILLAACLATIAMSIWRIVIKQLHDILKTNEDLLPTFIYGASEGAVSIIKGLRSQPDAKFSIKGLISPDNEISNYYVSGIKVYNNDLSLIATLIQEKIKVLLVSPLYKKHFRENERLIDELTEAHIAIYMTQEEQKWTPGQTMSPRMLKPINVEDLLPRDEININLESISQILKEKIILITGAAGSIGSELSKQIASFSPAKLILVDQAETPMHSLRLSMAQKYPDITTETIVTSITNKERMDSLFRRHRPDYVFHAAAYKHVPMMEDNPSEAVQNNIVGTRIIADLAVKYGVKKFVMISTDKAVNPTNVMGCSKRICEIYCQSLDNEIKREGSTLKQVDGSPAKTQFVTTRFGNVLGSNGSVIPIFTEQIKRGGPLTVTHPDIIRFFMLIPEACKLVLEAASFGNGGEIFVFDMGKPVRIADLAKRMIFLSGENDIEIKYTGLRDGEKLFEEVLSDAEDTLPTTHPKVRVAKVREYPYELILEQEKQLYEASLAFDDMETVRIMKKIVPEYKSKHSKYTALDN